MTLGIGQGLRGMILSPTQSLNSIWTKGRPLKVVSRKRALSNVRVRKFTVLLKCGGILNYWKKKKPENPQGQETYFDRLNLKRVNDGGDLRSKVVAKIMEGNRIPSKYVDW